MLLLLKDSTMSSRFTFRKLVQYFLQGLIILAPIAITIYAVTGLFNWIDRILPDLVAQFFPNLLDVDANGQPERFPGLGFLLVIVTLILVGFLASSFIVGRLVDLFDKILERTPGIRIIYSPLKDFFEAFAGNKRKFDKAVLVQVVSEHVWEVGFITQNDLSQFDLVDHVAVYVPNSYAFAGRLYLVSKDKVRILEGISSSDAMKFVVTGGVSGE
jgi:uncharacterized membrane protein